MFSSKKGYEKAMSDPAHRLDIYTKIDQITGRPRSEWRRMVDRYESKMGIAGTTSAKASASQLNEVTRNIDDSILAQASGGQGGRKKVLSGRQSTMLGGLVSALKKRLGE